MLHSARTLVQYGDGSCALHFGQPPKDSLFYFNNYEGFFCFVRLSFFSFVVLNYCCILVYSDPLSIARFVVSALGFHPLHPNENGWSGMTPPVLVIIVW